MRLLAVVREFPSAAQPGAGIFALRRLQAMQQLGFEVAVLRVTPHAPPVGRKWHAYRSIPKFEIIEGVPTTAFRAVFAPRLFGMEYLPLQLRAAMERFVASYKPDVVHASYVIPCGQLVSGLDVATVVSAHGIDAYDWPFRRPGLLRAARDAVASATRVSAVSGSLATEVRRIFPRDVDVIWNGGDERFFLPQNGEAARAALGLPLERAVIAFVGTIVRAKGIFDLVRAAAQLPSRPILAIAGNGPDAQRVAQEARERGLDLRCLGRLDQRALARLYAAADVVALPSYNEGLPNVICEAMLCSRAVVASTAGGIPEIVRDNQTGLLVQAGDVDGLARALSRACGDASLRHRLADSARAFAEANLTWRVAARKYAALYDAAVREKPLLRATTP